MSKILFYPLLWLLKIANKIIPVFRKNGGTMITGKIALMLDKSFILKFKDIDYDKAIMVTGTNGKTSTTNMLAHSLRNAEKTVATNLEGSNMLSGIATLLIKNSTLAGKFNKEFMVLEIDERSIQEIHKYLPANNLCITNLLKDQVQRNGDPDFIYRKIASVITDKMTLFLNNEEPRSKGLEDKAGQVIYYSLEQNIRTFKRDDFFQVSMPCPKCSSKIKYNYFNLENIGNFYCTGCEFESQKRPNVLVRNINYENKTFECDDEIYEVNYETPFYIYNYALNIAVCRYFRIPVETIKEGFKTFINPYERREEFIYNNKKIKYMRMKQENPETLQNALNDIAQDKSLKAILIGLFEIKDFPPTYTNTFYFWDCNFKDIVSTEVEKYISFSKSVAYDTTNRMIYAGVDKSKIITIDSDDIEEVIKELDNIQTDNIYLITGMKPYKKIKKILEKK